MERIIIEPERMAVQGRHHFGFTPVELLVVIAIWVALLLPAVQSAREAA